MSITPSLLSMQKIHLPECRVLLYAVLAWIQDKASSISIVCGRMHRCTRLRLIQRKEKLQTGLFCDLYTYSCGARGVTSTDDLRTPPSFLGNMSTHI